MKTPLRSDYNHKQNPRAAAVSKRPPRVSIQSWWIITGERVRSGPMGKLHLSVLIIGRVIL